MRLSKFLDSSLFSTCLLYLAKPLHCPTNISAANVSAANDVSANWWSLHGWAVPWQPAACTCFSGRGRALGHAHSDVAWRPQAVSVDTGKARAANPQGRHATAKAAGSPPGPAEAAHARLLLRGRCSSVTHDNVSQLRACLFDSAHSRACGLRWQIDVCGPQ